MIFDTMENACRYAAVSENFAEAFAFIRRAMEEDLPAGRYELKGKELFASIQEYETKSDAPDFEAHQAYIDIQALLSGEETMLYANVSDCVPKEAYDAKKDIAFFKADAAATLTFKRGSFAVFFPEDAHSPCICTGKPQRVRKVVVKVLADLQKA